MFQLQLDRIRQYHSIVILYIAPLAQKKLLHLCDSKEPSFWYNPLENAALFFAVKSLQADWKCVDLIYTFATGFGKFLS